MKKILALFLAIIIAITLVSCLDQKDTPTPAPDASPNGGDVVPDAPEEITPSDEPYVPPQIYEPVIYNVPGGSNIEFITGSPVQSGEGAPPIFGFSNFGFAVMARVVNTLPDTYYKIDVDSDRAPKAYRLVQMETLEIVVGHESMPRDFLYMIPESKYVDMSVYDSLLIGICQVGTEKCILKNGTENRFEHFEIPLFADYNDHPELGNVIAFSNGIFDEALWQESNWYYGYQFAKSALDNPDSYSARNLKVKRGDSVETVIANIKEAYGGFDADRIPLITLTHENEEINALLKLATPNGEDIFAQTIYAYSTPSMILTRFVNGCQTEERYIIIFNTEKIVYPELTYTDEDIATLKDISIDLAALAEEYKLSTPTPPKINPEEMERLSTLFLFAWYTKCDDKLYGVIKTTWIYRGSYYDDHMNGNAYASYYDDTYLLYDMTENTLTEMDKDTLVATLNSDRNTTYYYFLPDVDY